MLKSNKVFIIATALIFVLANIGYNQTKLAQKTKSDSESSRDNSAERYKIVMLGEVRADQFLIDTRDGRIWRKTAITDVIGNPVVWLYMDRIDNETEFVNWSRSHSIKSKSD
jgi:hypothetical protein